MTDKPERLPSRQRSEMIRVGRYETPEFGVIVPTVTALALIRRSYAIEAPRRSFARTDGTCIRLTEKGWAWVRE